MPTNRSSKVLGFSWLFIIGLALLISKSAHAETNNVVEVEKFSLNTSFGPVSGAEILKALFPNFELKSYKTGRKYFTVDSQSPVEYGNELATALFAQEFPYEKGQLAIIVSTHTDQEPKEKYETDLRKTDSHLFFYVIKKTSGQWGRADEYSLKHDDVFWRNCEQESCSITFEFAPYKMTSNERAFGLRYKSKNSGAGSGEESEDLLLFHRPSAGLKKIFEETVSKYEWTRSSPDPDEDGNVDSTETDQAFVLVVSDQMTKDHFDWILKSKPSKARNKSKSKSKKKNTETIYQWDGKRYVKSQPKASPGKAQ